MPVRLLSEMTYQEVSEIDLGAALTILPTGATEAHGPHLPLATDVLIAEAMARAGAEFLAAEGHEVFLLPPLAYTPATFASNFPGTLSVSPETHTALILDIARALAQTGFGTLVLANSHFDPVNIGALRQAVTTCTEDGILKMIFPDVTRRRWASRLGDEFTSGACHAGRYEGSVVKATRPDLVREDIEAELPANPTSLVPAIEKGLTSFEEAGGPRAYFGAPAEATAAEGEETIQTLGSILKEAVLQEWP